MKPRIRIFFRDGFDGVYFTGYHVPPGREAYLNGPIVSLEYASRYWFEWSYGWLPLDFR